MRRTVFLFMLSILLFPAFARADAGGPVRLSLIEGEAQVLIQETTDWTEAAVNLPLNEQDRLWIPDGGRAELQIQGGVFVRSEGDSSVDVLTVNRDAAQFYLDRGHLYISNRPGGVNTVQVDTPSASIRSYDNSILMIDLSGEGDHEISVLKGEVYAESRAGGTSVSAGSTLTIRGERSAEISPIGAPDDWERWNADRDRELTAWSESSRYLPDELHLYASDFDQHGRWHYSFEYGYVWSPVVVAGWAPYTSGSWIWIRGSHVWIDYDPWGWAPSHYGRWVFIGGRGWCWVPPAAGAVYWGPGFVGWIVTPAYVAWVPLAPGEIYYGYGHYGPASVNLTTVNINTVVVNRTYRNASARNSVVAVQRDSFGTGRRAPVRLRENPFVAARGHDTANIVPPRVRPERPVVVAPARPRRHSSHALGQPDAGKTAPQRRILTTPSNGKRRTTESVERSARTPRTTAKPPSVRGQQPPERVRRNRPQELKKVRPVVPQRGVSVFQRQQPKELSVTRSGEPRTINRGRKQKQQSDESRSPRRQPEQRRRR